jgi:hypothetical protein
MAMLPVIPNMTCDIFRQANLGAASPDVGGVSCFLTASYIGHAEHGEKDPVAQRYSHSMLIPIGTDCRDGYDAGVYGNSPDWVGIPAGASAANRTNFSVIFVERKASGYAADHLKVYLDRVTPQWPSKYT